MSSNLSAKYPMDYYTATRLVQDGESTRKSSFLAGGTNSGPVIHGIPQRMISDGSQAPSTAMSFYNASSPSRTTIEGAEHKDKEVLGVNHVVHKVTTPVVREIEEIREKIVKVPEVVKRKEVVNEEQFIRETIVKVATPVDKIVIVPEPVTIVQDRLVEVSQSVPVERLVYKDVWENREVIHENPIVQEIEKPVHYDVIEFLDVPQPKTVKNKEKQIIEKVVEKPVPKYVEVEVPEYKEVEEIEEVTRVVPVPYERKVNEEYSLPTLRSEYEEIPIPVFVPQFKEVAVPAEYMTDAAILQAQQMQFRINSTAGNAIPSLCVLESLGQEARNFQPDMIYDPALISKRLLAKINRM